MKLSDAITQLHNEGLSVSQIAVRLFKPESTIIRYLKREKLLKLPRKKTTKVVDENPELMAIVSKIRELATFGYSQSQIARQLSLSRQTVLKYRKQFDIPMADYKGTQSHQETPQKMVAFLKKRGFKPRVIAQRLNLSLSTVYEYQSRAKGTRKALWKKPPGYKPVQTRNKGYQAEGVVSVG